MEIPGQISAEIDKIKTAGPGKVDSAGDMRPSSEIEALVLAQIEPIDQVNHVGVGALLLDGRRSQSESPKYFL